MIGMLIIASSELLSSPPDVVDQLPVALAWNSSSTGLFVIRRTVPAIELAPYSVPCGPGSTSMRSISET